MEKEQALLLWFEAVERKDVALVGGKASSLGELTAKTAVHVPYGFTTTAYAYRCFMQDSGLHGRIQEILAALTDVENGMQLRKVSAAVRKAILSAEMPAALAGAIRSAYAELSRKAGIEEPFVAIRSSATAEDLPDASFAGQQDTYLNIRGAEAVIEKVKECYASTFTDRAVYYRVKQGFDHSAVALSAVIQMMVFSKAAGVMFTVNVANGDDTHVMIEGSWGLGEYIVQGVVTPDSYLVNKQTLKIDKQVINEKKIKYVRKASGGCAEEKVPQEDISRSVLSGEQVRALAQYAISIEQHYGCYMDIEWGIDERTDKLWILQARPETVWSRRTEAPKKDSAGEAAMNRSHQVLVKGRPASPGVVSGAARVILDPAEIDGFQPGEILVTTMTAPDWVPVMKKARGIVTDAGGMTCHASIVSRELGIPCIVGTKSCGEAGTAVIRDGMQITLDAAHGIVYAGNLMDEGEEKQEVPPAAVESYPVTGTKIYMNLGDPELAEKYSRLPCDGIGLMREEFIWTTYIHEHPLYMLAGGRGQEAVDKLAEGMRMVCQAMAPRPVTLRFSDFKSSEYRELKGGDAYEPHEPSALLGWRGASRYYDPQYTEAFKLELRAVRKTREEYGLKNLNVMIPFCRTVEEAQKVTALMAQEGLHRGPDFKVWLMAEIPANILLADKFNEFVDGYSIGSNDLTMLVLGCDRDNDAIAHLFDERNLAVKRAIHHLIETAHEAGKTVSICGQAPSVYLDFAEFLIQCGIDSISVNPDTVGFTRKHAAQIEQRLLLNAVAGHRKKNPDEFSW